MTISFQNGFVGTFLHPIEIAESFRYGSFISSPYNVKHTTEGLVKLLMYGDYVKNMAESKNTSLLAIVKEDLENYQYVKKDVLKVVE